MKVTEHSQRSGKEFVIRCFCGADHFIVLSYDRWDGDEWYASVVERWGDYNSLWRRLKAAWAVIRMGDSHGTEIMLNKHDVKAMQEWWGQFDA